MEQGLNALMWLLAIVVMIPAVLWLLKRTPMGGGTTGPAGLRSVASLPLSTSQRVVTVEVGRGEARRWLVLGVTAHSITTLHTMEAQDEPPAASPDGGGFPSLLAKFRGGREGGGDAG